MNNFGCMGNRELRSRAIEVTLVNKKLIKVRSDSRSLALHPLNKPNGQAGDCQLPITIPPPSKDPSTDK